MFVGIAAEGIELSMTDPEQQQSVLRFIQADPASRLRSLNGRR
jgi:hypothetical protein